jgi:hypothetical protein
MAVSNPNANGSGAIPGYAEDNGTQEGTHAQPEEGHEWMLSDVCQKPLHWQVPV